MMMGLISMVTGFFASYTDRKADFKAGIFTHAGYYLKKQKVFYYGGFSNNSTEELSGADTPTFEILSSKFPDQAFASCFARDSRQVYYLGKVIPNADPTTFVVLGFDLSKDANQVFLRYTPISGDAPNFQRIDGNLFRDSNHVFSGGRKISDDPANFKVIGKWDHLSYYSDSHGIMINETRIERADIKTFKPLRYGYSKDSRRVYLMETTHLKEVSGADPATFKVINTYFTADARHVFWRGKLLPDADPATFEILNEEIYSSRDARFYSKGIKKYQTPVHSNSPLTSTARVLMKIKSFLKKDHYLLNNNTTTRSDKIFSRKMI